MKFNDTTLIRGNEVLLRNNAVLRNTYLLLSMTLIFSSLTAYYAVVSNAGFGGSMVAFILSFVLLFATNALRNSVWGLVTVFAFTGCIGYSMGPMLNYFIHGYKNGGQLIMTALAGTGLTFFVTSLYAFTTKRDLSYLGKFLTTGLIIAVVASLANIFFKMPALQLAISTALTFISAMLMMYDTNRIVNNGEDNYIMATISLFLDIQILFQNLLYLLGAFNGRE